ncbi:dynamin family protein [Campylobacter hominis]|uniref:dynamin family protein n=1 Tax=Campylobacter hominis TaxID=76517 RepID=UPI001CBD80D3|nr:dynamin family protein [Campylobacter hominis]UAK86330.1 dynamin family protein [Campylobacter hominis]
MTISEICQKFDIDGVNERFQKSLEDKIEIGFLGEFSSGKSSLINSLLDRNLLSINSLPTTKTVVEINFSNKDEFFKKDGDTISEISEDEFANLQTKDGKFHLIANISAATERERERERVNNSDFVFIDTPGVSSLDKSDFDITLGYLPRLECAIICQDINQGGLTKSVIDFISQNLDIKNNLIFCLTKSDLKPQNTRENIKKSVLEQLKDLNIENLEDKIVFTSTKEPNTELLNLINDNFYSKFTKIKKQKIAKNTKIFSKELSQILKQRVELIDFNTDELDEKLKNIKKEEDKIQDEIQNQYLKLDKFIQSLETKIYSQCLNDIDLLKDGKTQEFFESMIKIIEENTKNYFNEYFTFNVENVDISNFKNMQKDLNLNENIKKFLMDTIPYIANKIIFVLSEKLSEKLPKPVVAIIITILQKFEIASKFIIRQLEKLFTKNKPEVAKAASAVVINLTKEYINKVSNEQIFEPLKNKLQTTKDSISDTIALKSKKIDEIKKTRNDMKETIIELENFINS